MLPSVFYGTRFETMHMISLKTVYKGRNKSRLGGYVMHIPGGALAFSVSRDLKSSLRLGTFSREDVTVGQRKVFKSGL